MFTYITILTEVGLILVDAQPFPPLKFCGKKRRRANFSFRFMFIKDTTKMKPTSTDSLLSLTLLQSIIHVVWVKQREIQFESISGSFPHVQLEGALASPSILFFRTTFINILLKTVTFGCDQGCILFYLMELFLKNVTKRLG